MSLIQEEQTYLKLSVWIRARLPAKLISYAPSALTGLTGDDLHLHEQVYTWESQEDMWSGIQDPEKISEARELLTQGFSPALSPEERNFEKFQTLISVLDALCKEAEWTDCLQDHSEERIRANQLLVLKNHFEWIHSIFRTVPGASVMVR